MAVIAFATIEEHNILYSTSQTPSVDITTLESLTHSLCNNMLAPIVMIIEASRPNPSISTGAGQETKQLKYDRD